MPPRKNTDETTATMPRTLKGRSGDPEAPPPTRAEALQAVVTTFLAEWKAYCDDENCENPTPRFWDACGDVCDLFTEGDIPHQHRELAQAVERLGQEAFAFENRADQTNYQPAKPFWKAVEEVNRLARTASAPERKPPLESMVELRRQGVSNAQIAVIWGASTDEVAAELAKPGSVCTPEYCAAAEARRFKISRAERFGRETPVVDRGQVASMLEAGTGVAEICETTGATPDQVEMVRRNMHKMEQR